MAKDLELSLKLPISDANEGLLPLIADDEGWTADALLGSPDEHENPTAPITAVEFLCDLLKKDLTTYLSGKIAKAITNQYGKSQDALKATVLEQLKEELVVTVEIKERVL